MTYGEVLAQIVSEITGRPKESIMEIVTSIMDVFPHRQKLEQEIPEDKVELLLEELRKEKQTIAAQLLEYAMERETIRHGNA
jgi:hypothetical protein